MRQLLRYLKPYWKSALIAPLLMILEVSMDLLQPRMMQRIIDEGIRLGDQSLVLETGALMIVFALLGAVGGIGCTIYAVRAAINTGTDLRSSVYRKISTLSFGNLDRLGTGQLVTRLTNDITQVQDVILISLRVLVRVPLIGIGSLMMAFLTSPQLALIALPLTVPVLFMLWYVINRAQPLYTQVQASLDRVNTVIQENLSGVHVIKAFVRERHERERFGDANTALTMHSIRAMNLTAITSPVMLLLMNVGTAAVIWFGGVNVTEGTLTTGEIIAVITYLTQMLSTLVSASMLLMRIARAQASAERIVEVLNSVPDLQDRPNALQDFHPKGRVAFENVTFGYGEPVLKDVSFVAEPGQTVAILGATGSGKSSLVHLIPRFYDVTGGRVTIDGVDVRDISQQALRAQISVSLQEAILFSGSVASNIQQGNAAADDEAIHEAARAAQAQEFIERMPEGYETHLGQRGVNLSGGQKQRLAIARALVRQPVILILDDSTSAVDMETESRLQQELSRIMHQRTSFVVAQRISTVLAADKILVLDNGQLVAEGTHDELIVASPIYRQIYESQLGAPEDVSTQA
ncbi:ABC transporter ATP-binding protein [Phototrophicus methaneseepsis]|uniref:ABC transporter ATP-binding protein n=1 Tax=Phototrophicus methaneseepsis TaxID=2710758 RepID=A0A7S8IH34_9CHLR|nr:ABC transporter ATP-binding protein [Phototrophicus methaneseepsis]QPC84928.1 ABC transporter ATP-binding protein [Phototrophicus methaneseepsis]